VETERFQIICPACGQQVEAIARDGRVKGFCAVTKQFVNLLIETRRTAESKAKIHGKQTPIRDSRGHFVKGNVPLNKKYLS
jgi:endogenous inhibitor of DNA gyrase (YacG/DUF329 family)